MWSLILCVLGLTQFISASAFTFILGANQKSCYYIFTENQKFQFVIILPFKVVDHLMLIMKLLILMVIKLFLILNKDKVILFSMLILLVNMNFVSQIPCQHLLKKVIDFEIKFENEDNAEKFRANLPNQPDVKTINSC